MESQSIKIRAIIENAGKGVFTQLSCSHQKEYLLQHPNPFLSETWVNWPSRHVKSNDNVTEGASFYQKIILPHKSAPFMTW